jgi:DNA-binding IclR family transcriptional regulator
VSGNSTEPGRTVASKAVAVLLALTAGREHTLSSVARQTHLPMSTAYRLLHDLAASPVVERTANGEYRPGPALHDLAVVATPPTLFTHGSLAVDDLAEALQTTVRLGVIHGSEAAYIEKVPGPSPGTCFPNHGRLPLHATALGKMLLTFAPALLVRLVGSGLPRFTSHTLTTLDELRHALRHARERGFATCHRELDPAVCALAVPVLGGTGDPIAAIEVHVPDLNAHTLANVSPALFIAARALGRELAPVESTPSDCA